MPPAGTITEWASDATISELTSEAAVSGKASEAAVPERTEQTQLPLDLHAVRLASQPSVTLVIPARNEARNLPYVLENLPGCLTEVILVDGHSSDITCSIARRCRPDIRIISEPQPGKGYALRAGFEAARGDIIVAMDADGSMSPTEIPQYIYFLENGFDFVKGSRFIGGGGSLDITAIRRLGNRGLLAVANALYGSKLTDLCYGFFAFRRQYLDHLDLRSSGFEIETELTIRAVVSGLRIAEVPSLELPRRSGRSNLHAIQDGQRVLRTLIDERQRDQASSPTRIHSMITQLSDSATARPSALSHGTALSHGSVASSLTPSRVESQ